MKLRMRHTAPVVIVAFALCASTTLLVASASGGAKDAKPSLAAVSDCEPVPARCGSEASDLEIVAASEAARHMLETAAMGESPEQAGLASGSASTVFERLYATLVPEAWGALIDYESLAAAAR